MKVAKEEGSLDKPEYQGLWLEQSVCTNGVYVYCCLNGGPLLPCGLS